MAVKQEPPRELGQTVAIFWIWGLGPVKALWWEAADDEHDPACWRQIQQMEPEFDPAAPVAWVKRWIGTEEQVHRMIAGCPAVVNAGHFQPVAGAVAVDTVAGE